MRQTAQARQHGIQPLQPDVASGLQLQRVAGVVDVFAGAGKVHEFAGRLQLGAAFKAALDPVFDGLDVVIGGFFYGFDGLGIGFGKVLPQANQKFARAGRQGGELGQPGIREGDESGYFHLHAALHVTQLAHDGAQGLEFGGVAPVQR